MKKNILSILIIVLSLNAYAQDETMFVHKGTAFFEFNINNMDSLKPKLGDTPDLDSLFIYNNNGTVNSFRVLDVDSITFYKSPETLRMNDSLALVALYNATDGANWTNNTNWLSDRPISEWYGVDCGTLGRVNGLDLYYNNLTGNIPPEIGQLTQLNYLSLRFNNLTGNIPSEIGQLTQLTYSDLGVNNLTGNIPPEIGKLTQLNHLELAANNLTGNIPSEIGQLTQLTHLYLQLNNLTGNIPPEIGKLTQLTELRLNENNLTGNIPPEIGKLTLINLLDLHINNLTGNIPPEIGELTQLTWLDLGYNKLTGNIPPEIGKLTQLTWLSLASNNLTGNIPPEIGQLTKLSGLYLGVNNLTGNIPPEIGQLTQLTALNLAYNNLTGNIPEELANLPSNIDLNGFDLRNNRLTGKIPDRIVQHPSFDSRLVWGLAIQQAGYGLERVIPTMPNATLVNQDGDTIVAHTFFVNHKLTVLVDWATSCPWSQIFMPALKEMYDYYHDKGLGVLSFSYDYGDQAQATVEDYRARNNLTWDNFDGNSNRIDIPRFEGPTPLVHIVNQKGEILFSEFLWDAYSEMLETRETVVQKFIASILGEINPGDLYESTDFSKDGEVLTLQTKTAGNGVNFVIVGDGYVDKDMNAGGKYETVMREAMEHLFSVEPLKSYREYFNVYAVKAVSKNEGIGSPRQTVFSSEFGSGTAVGGNDALVATYAEKIPGIDLTQSPVLVVLNSPAYAGTCYNYADGSSIAYCPRVGFDSASFGDVVHHELLGHGFGRLLDEYIYNNTPITPDYIVQFNLFRSINMGYNLTLDVNDLPWQHIIGKPGYEMVGTYEGGYFFSQGVWRSEENSCMNNNVPYFSAISRELMVKRILETAGETYTWEKFAAKDKYEPYVPLRSDMRSSQPFVPLAPPVFVKGSLK